MGDLIDLSDPVPHPPPENAMPKETLVKIESDQERGIPPSKHVAGKTPNYRSDEKTDILSEFQEWPLGSVELVKDGDEDEPCDDRPEVVRKPTYNWDVRANTA